VACEVWSTEVCEVLLTKNLSGKPAKIRLGKSRRILRKILRGYLCSSGMSVFMVIMELVHMHEGLERFQTT
jgi:hypothetical protein